MNVTISPSVAKGEVVAPPSKSVAHRALICAALTDGSVVENIAYSQDVEATLRCLEAMGAFVERRGDSVRLGSLRPAEIPDGVVLDCGESGSTLRFLLPLCLLSEKRVSFVGHGRLMERPMEIYRQLCHENGLIFEQSGGAITVCGPLQAGSYRLSGKVSSQFITGLLFALSVLPQESRLEISDRLESASYINITLAVMAAFGMEIRHENQTFLLCGGNYCRRSYRVEGDCSNAAFLDAFNLLDGDVKVLGLSGETAQGDWVYRDFYQHLTLGSRQFDLTDCPDLGPVMFALAAVFGGAEFSGTKRLRIKESDRGAAMQAELRKFGIDVQIGENTVTIGAGELKKPSEVLCGHNDHRIVMALSLLCSRVGGCISGAEVVAKSYPNFFDDIRRLSVDISFC